MTKIRIVAISDTHTKHRQLTIPSCDVLIHAGDFSFHGERDEVLDFVSWFQEQPAKLKIFTPGNHEPTLDVTHRSSDPTLMMELGAILAKDKTTHMLLHDGMDLFDLDVPIFGTPWTPYFGGWGFNGHEAGRNGFGPSLRKKYDQIPKETRILISHGPPHGTLDRNINGEMCGSHELQSTMERPRHRNLRLCIFGHIHEGRGYMQDPKTGVVFCNAASVDHTYTRTYSPIIIDYNVDAHTVNNIEER